MLKLYKRYLLSYIIILLKQIFYYLQQSIENRWYRKYRSIGIEIKSIEALVSKSKVSKLQVLSIKNIEYRDTFDTLSIGQALVWTNNSSLYAYQKLASSQSDTPVIVSSYGRTILHPL